MSNCETIEELTSTHGQLHKMHEQELKYLTTAKVETQVPSKSAQLQINLDHIIGCLSIVYVFSFLEASQFNLNNKWFKKLDLSTRQKLKAWKHLRHSAAHGLDGERATRYASEFDDVIQTDNNFNTIVSLDPNSNRFNVISVAGLRLLADLIHIFEAMINQYNQNQGS